MGHHDFGHSFGHHSSHHGHHSDHHGYQTSHRGHHAGHHGHVQVEPGLGYHHYDDDHNCEHECSPMCFLAIFGVVLLIAGIVIAVVLELIAGIVVIVLGFLSIVGGIVGGNMSRCDVSHIVLMACGSHIGLLIVLPSGFKKRTFQ